MSSSPLGLVITIPRLFLCEEHIGVTCLINLLCTICHVHDLSLGLVLRLSRLVLPSSVHTQRCVHAVEQLMPDLQIYNVPRHRQHFSTIEQTQNQAQRKFYC